MAGKIVSRVVGSAAKSAAKAAAGPAAGGSPQAAKTGAPSMGGQAPVQGVVGMIGRVPSPAAGKALEMKTPVPPSKMVAGIEMLNGSCLDKAAEIPVVRDVLPHAAYVAAGGGVTGAVAKYATKKLIEARTPKAEREDLKVVYDRTLGAASVPGAPKP